MNESLYKVVFFFGSPVQRAELVLTAAGWRLNKKALESGSMEPLGRVEVYVLADGGKVVLDYVAEGLRRKKSSHATIKAAGVHWRIDATLAQPMLFLAKDVDASYELKLEFILDEASGRFTGTIKPPGRPPDQKPVLFCDDVDGNGEANLTLERTGDWKLLRYAGIVAEDQDTDALLLAEAEQQARTSVVAWRRTSDTNGTSNLLQLYGVDLSSRKQSLNNRSTDVVLINRREDGNLRLSQQLAPRRRQTLSLSQYLAETAWSLELGPVSAEDYCAVWSSALHEPVVAGLARLRGSATSFLPRLFAQKKFAERGAALLAFEFVFDAAFGEKSPERAAVRSTRLRSLRPSLVCAGEAWFRAQLLGGALDAVAAVTVRNGSLAVVLGDNTGSHLDLGALRLMPAANLAAKLSLWLRSALGCSIYRGEVEKPPLDLRIEVETLALADVAPGATDGVPDAARAEADAPLSAAPEERQNLIEARGGAVREDTLVIPLSGGESTPARLRATEIYEPFHQRRLQLEIFAESNAPTLQSVLVIDPAPLFVGQLAGIRLKPDGDVEEIANYSESELDGSKWELGGIRRAFRLRLPPQAVGEAAEKGSRFEPALKPGQPIDYRLSAPATLELQSSWFEQRFNEAPWNVRRVFGYTGQRAPGAGVVTLEFELVYGLQTRFDAQALNHRVQLAELGARVGALPPELDLQKLPIVADPRRGIMFDAAEQLVRLRRRHAHRLAQLELYNPAALPPAGTSLPAATADFGVDRGLVFTLRDSAQMEHPLRPGEHWNLGAVPVPADGFLRGGAVWGFESARVFDEVRTRPRSDSGWLRQLRFSALGAYGEQRSVFANGKSSISVVAQMGRLSSYVIERVGRIAGSWNRARHVIEYQRTVLPSRQFAASQPLHAGRPLLRKVREYVELLEPCRATKSAGQTVPGARFVEQIDFQSRIIPVDGAWGRDLDHGWAIPLWDALADPEIYPRPHVCAECAGSADESPLSKRVSEPQRLLFYTSTRPEDGENSNLWDPVLGVDYDDLPLPDPRAGFGAAFQTRDYVDADATLPAEAAEPLGMYRYTLPLEPHERPSNLIAGTNGARIAARIDNVSLMRAASVAAPGSPGAALLAGISDGNDALVRLVNGARSALKLADPQQRKQRAAALEASTTQLGKALQAQVRKADVWLHDQTQQADRFARQARDDVEMGLLQSVGRELDDLQRALETYRGEAQRFAARACQLTEAQAQAQAQEWLSELRQLASGIDGAAAPTQQRFARGLAAACEQIEKAVERAKTALHQQAQQLYAILSGAGSWEQRRRDLAAALIEFRARRGALLPQAVQLIGRMPKSALRTLLQELAQRLAALEQSVAAAEEALAQRLADAASTPEQVRQRIDELLKQAVTDLDEALAPLRKARAQIDDALDRIDVGSIAMTRWADVLAERVRTVIGDAFAAGDQRCSQLRERIDRPFADVLRLVNAARPQLPGALAAARSQFDALLRAGEALAVRVSTALANAEAELQTVLKRLQADVLDAADEIALRLQRLAAPLEPAFAAVESALSRVRAAPSFRAPNETLRLLRAVGEGPVLPRMTVNRDRLAYVFDDYVAEIRTSPAAALVDRIGDDLKALGVRVPFDALGEDLLPPALRHFDLNRLLPDFAGLRCFDGLFGGLKMPDLSEHGIRIRHGFDKEQQSAWLQADLDLTLDQRVEIFSLAGLSLSLRRGRMTGQARLAADIDGLRSERKWAQIKGDWELSFGGYTLVRFVDTPLRLDHGGTLRFDVDARKIVLDRALAWLEDVVKQFSDPDSGFTLELLKDENGLPAGVRAALELPLPPLGGGAVTVAGIILRAFFALEIEKRYPGTDTSGFALSAGFGLGKPTQPFSLFIAFLGGGGYLGGSATYWPSLPRKRNFVAQVDLGIAVGAAAAFFLGPVRGHVMVLVGLRASYRAVGTGSRLSAALTLLISGSASLYGLVTIGLTLYLELIYGGDKSLRGDGYFSASVRISRFFKVRYSAPIRYQLAKGSGGNRKDDAYQSAAQARRATRC